MSRREGVLSSAELLELELPDELDDVTAGVAGVAGVADFSGPDSESDVEPVWLSGFTPPVKVSSSVTELFEMLVCTLPSAVLSFGFSVVFVFGFVSVGAGDEPPEEEPAVAA